MPASNSEGEARPVPGRLHERNASNAIRAIFAMIDCSSSAPYPGKGQKESTDATIPETEIPRGKPSRRDRKRESKYLPARGCPHDRATKQGSTGLDIPVHQILAALAYVGRQRPMRRPENRWDPISHKRKHPAAVTVGQSHEMGFTYRPPTKRCWRHGAQVRSTGMRPGNLTPAR